jgi:hypothetical protein
MVMHICNPSTWETETGGSRVRAQPGIHRETLSQKKKKNFYEIKKEKSMLTDSQNCYIFLKHPQKIRDWEMAFLVS